MVRSKETSPAAYLASLPPERRKVVSALRAVVRKHLPTGYVESMNWGMIAYEIPLARYPDTYNGQPLMYLALAAQKNNYALYMQGIDKGGGALDRLAAAYEAAGRRLDLGTGGCLRFKSIDELPLDVIAEIVASTPVKRRIELAESGRSTTSRSAGRTGGASR